MAVRKALTLTVGIAAFALAVLLVYRYAPQPSIERPILKASLRVEPDLPEFTFAPLDEPRRLPDIAFTDGDGVKLNLADFRGRVVLLNLWATWCPPCRREMPALDRLQAAFGGPDFEVVALSIDKQGAPAVRDFYRELELQALAIYIDSSGKAPQRLGAIGIPTTLLIDRSNREIGRVVGAAEWDGPEALETIRRYLRRSPTGQAPGAMERTRGLPTTVAKQEP